MKTSCSLCASGARDMCPALNVAICSQCCGSKRNRAIQCPGTCKYNPLSRLNYDAWLKIDSALSTKMLQYLSRYYDEASFREVVTEMLPSDSQQALGIAYAAAAYYLLFMKPLASGRLVYEIWQESEWQGLTGDESVMMQYRIPSAPALIEVQKILDHQLIECRDLLRPERGVFVMIDRCMAKQVARFERVWCWLVDYPFFSRPAGDPVSVPDKIELILMDKIMADASKIRSGGTFKGMCGKNFGKYGRLVAKETERARVRVLNAMELHECKAFYRLKSPREDVRKVLDSKEDFVFVQDGNTDQPVSPAAQYSWLRAGMSQEVEAKLSMHFRHQDSDKNKGLLGEVLLGQDEMMIRTMSKRLFSFAKKMVARYWGDSLEFTRECIVDVAKQMAHRQADGREDRNDTMPLEVRQKMADEFYREHYERFFDDELPALDGMTPRKAAQNARMRPRLIGVMKQHITGIERFNKTEGTSVNIDWVLKELGLTELL